MARVKRGWEAPHTPGLHPKSLFVLRLTNHLTAYSLVFIGKNQVVACVSRSKKARTTGACLFCKVEEIRGFPTEKGGVT